MICAYNFYNIFTTNFKWLVVIIRLKKSNLSVKFKFELIITNHMWFVVKMLWKYYGHSTYFLIPPQISVTTFFFPSLILAIAHTLGQADRAARISVITLPKFMHSLSPTFSLSLSYFCWISATELPKFTLSPHSVAEIHSLSSFP